MKNLVLLACLSIITLMAFSSNARNIRADGATESLNFQTAGLNTRMSIDSAGLVNFPNLTISRTTYIDASGDLVSSTVTNTTHEFNDATSSIQTQIDSKVADADAVKINAEATMTTSSGIHFPAVSDAAGELDLIVLPQRAGVPTATPTLGEASMVWDSTNDDLYIWSGTGWDQMDSAGSGDDVDLRSNIGIAGSVATSALTVELKVKDGSTDPSGGDAIDLSFRNATVATGGYVSRSVSSALSLVVPSGATLGTTSAVESEIYVYAIDNAGTVELAVSLSPFLDVSILYSTIALSAAADSKHELYSTTLRSNIAIRFLGSITSSQTTAGTWASAPTEIDTGGEIQNLTVYIKDLKSSGTAGGTCTSGSFLTRDLNTMTGAGFVTLSSDQFTLAIGTYNIAWSAPGIIIDGHSTSLRNITDAVDEALGGTAFAQGAGGTNHDTSISKGFTSVTITATKTFEIRHRCATTRASDGFGPANSFGVSNVYTQVKITKVE